MESLIDTNVIIRYLVDDDPVKSLEIQRMLSSDQRFYLSDVVVAEIVWVLTSYYDQPKGKVIAQIRALLDLDSISSNKEVLLEGLDIWEKTNIGYIDSYIYALSVVKGFREIYSYDKRLSKAGKIKIKEPSRF